MMMHVSCNDCTATRPATTVEAVISFAFTSAARFFSVLRFYFYAFSLPGERPSKKSIELQANRGSLKRLSLDGEPRFI